MKWRALKYLGRVAAALRAAGRGRVLVVDPASTDDTAAIARSLGADVISLPERAGPAGARNAGDLHVAAEVVLFIDSDCVVEAIAALVFLLAEVSITEEKRINTWTN